MLVSKKRYDKLKAELEYSERKRMINRDAYWEVKHDLDRLKDKWNKLVRDINSKGGQEFLEGKTNTFTDDELKSLLQLVHPDKHGGKASAVAITQKINSLRG